MRFLGMILACVCIFIIMLIACYAESVNSDERLEKCRAKHGIAQIDNRGVVRGCLIQL